MNEVLILETTLHGKFYLFMLDTGYAGPPVLSRSYLCTSKPFLQTDIATIYKKVIHDMQHITIDDENRAVNEYINYSQCLPYTSGCTMRLMGIGSIQEQQADMLMCPMLKIKNKWNMMSAPKKMTHTHADVFVTNSLRSSVHIITCDFLMHHAPCLINMKNEELRTNLSISEYLYCSSHYNMFDTQLIGGSFVVPIEIEGQLFRFTVDTGAPGPISIGVNTAKKLKTCNSHAELKKIHQKGVNGETVCSQLVELDVIFCGENFKSAAFLNDLPTDHVDGYVGLGFLRGYDILLSTKKIGFRKNYLEIRNFDYYVHLSESGICQNAPSCLKKEKNKE